MSIPEILQKVMSEDEEKETFRPTLDDEDDLVIHAMEWRKTLKNAMEWRKTLKKCWAEKPKERLDFQEIYQMAMGLQT